MEFEFTFLDWLQGIRTPWLDKLMVFISILGNGGLIWIFLSAVFIAVSKYRKCGFMMLAALLLGVVVGNLFLKNIVGRDRPFELIPPNFELLIPPPEDRSFPSGHTMSSFACATVIFSVDHRMGLAAFLMAALMGMSRMYLYVHFPSDIIGGVIVGVLIAVTVVHMMEKSSIW